jgi:hypothetical protein
MEAGKFSFKFSRQTQKNLVGSSKYAYFSPFGQKLSALVHLNSKNGDYRFSALVRLNTVSALVPLNMSALVPLNMSALVLLGLSALVQHPLKVTWKYISYLRYNYFLKLTGFSSQKSQGLVCSKCACKMFWWSKWLIQCRKALPKKVVSALLVPQQPILWICVHLL